VSVLLISCPDRPGLVAATAGILHRHGANIVSADQHTDAAHGLFLQRIEYTLAPDADADALGADLAAVAAELGMTLERRDPTATGRVAILVSKEGHCLYDLLSRVALGDIRAEVPIVISNHDDHREVTERFGVPFLHLPVDPDDRESQQRAVLAALDAADIDLVVLARYMQIIPPWLVDRYPNRIINIHHSFLPAFIGARPYHRAHERGVKIIGATAHYVTVNLDEGPIICQDVTPVSHRDDVERLIQLGGDIEQTVLARAVRLHLDHRVLTYANRTVVFS
jgi:formyltetrahydrofolate deformylase